jgi:hypothetical protein
MQIKGKKKKCTKIEMNKISKFCYLSLLVF